jgi:hypothetical protein
MEGAIVTTTTKKTVAALAISAWVMPGCATRPDNVVASSVSSSRYADRTCKSLSRELDEVQDALRVQSAKLNDKANQDAVVTGVGVILFWPVLFALGNNAGLEGDVARLKGEEQAIRRQMREADCETPPPRSTPAGSTASAAPAPSTTASAAPVSSQVVNDPAPGGNATLPAPARLGEDMK